MHRYTRMVVATGMCLFLTGGASYADPAPAAPAPVAGLVHLASPSSVHTDAGTDARLPPGYFLDEAAFAALDTETKRLQTAETRLTAENQSLRASAGGNWVPGWMVVTLAVVGGVTAGWIAHERL